ncbi:hypothetical protein GW830_03370 [bacterium]|nr:hypothetical protein [bacterium]
MYPEGTKVVIYRDGIYHYNTPGEWRLYNDKTEEDNHPHSEQINIESDMIAFTCDYNLIETKKRTDVLQYYFDFLRVHPFADSNLTVISIIHDLECKKYGFETMDLLQIRFEDRKFYLYFLYYYENNKNKMGILDEIIKLIDDFHNKKLSQKVIDEKDKIIIKTTTELF